MKKEIIELAHREYDKVEAIYLLLAILGIGGAISLAFKMPFWIIMASYGLLGIFLEIVKLKTQNPYKK